MSVTTPVIVALDYPHQNLAFEMADRLDPQLCRVKVGKELFTREGPDVVKGLQERGFEVFLDLKYHDIPNTVAKACAVAADLGVWMVNVHASGGRRMMEAAKRAVEQTCSDTILIAVTVLTSMGREDLAEIGLDLEPMDQVKRLSRLAKASGLDGVVCSAQEARELKVDLGAEFALVTPGIRLENSEQDDQRRVMTPLEAKAAGVDYMVIGRPITQAKNPSEVLESIVSQLMG